MHRGRREHAFTAPDRPTLRFHERCYGWRMVRRLDVTSSRRTNRADWPSDDLKTGHLFAARTRFRRLIVVVDAELLEAPAEPTAGITRPQLLGELLDNDLIRTFRYSDDGPPASVTPIKDRAAAYEGWAVVTHRDPTGETWGVTFKSETGASLAGVHGNGGDVAARDRAAGAYSDLDPLLAEKLRRSDWLAAQVAAQAVGSDLYVSERPYLHSATWDVARGVTLCNVSDALSMIGLYLRAQDVFIVGGRVKFNRGLFYWVGTRELLPAAWRWFTGCVQHSTGSGDDALLLLGGSLLQRVERALEARDGLHLTLNQPQNNDTQSSALAYLDTVLLFLMAAVDVAARVAHRTLGLPSDREHLAAWQRGGSGGWLSQVRAVAPALASLVEAPALGAETLTILRLLRNSVHGTALQGLAFVSGSTPLQSLFGLPDSAESAVLAAMDASGGRKQWGVVATQQGREQLDLGVFVDSLFQHTIVLLNELMDATPVDALAHVALQGPDVGPPADSGQWPAGGPFDSSFRTSIRWLLGF